MRLKNLKHRPKRYRRGVSEIMGAVLMIGVTISVGFGVWAYASSAAQTSEHNFGNAIVSNMNYLKENYVIANVNFSSTQTTSITVWFYNNGNATDYIKQIWISNITSTKPWTNTTTTLSSTYTSGCGYCLKLSVGTVTPISLKVNTAFVSGVIYQVKAIGEYGNTYSYQQAR